MQQLETLRQKVQDLYTSNDPNADVWIDWSYPNHVLVVAELAERICKKHGANAEFAIAGALLHDIADATMARKSPEHADESLAIAERLLQESGFSAEDMAFVINEVIKPHSCRETSPTTIEGKAMATADGAAHFLTDFYPLFCWRHYGPKDDYEAFKDWMRAKLEKDINKKFFFDDIKQEIMPRYEALKLVFFS